MKLITLLSMVWYSLAVSAAVPEKYVYKIDLQTVVEDRVKVELTVPKISKSEIVFYLPKIIPGTYRIADYGRYVSDFKALDKRGNELSIERLDDNSWRIENANKLKSMTYWVEDSFDSEVEGEYVFEPAGTNIEDGISFVMNAAGIFGYFEGKKQMEFEINVVRGTEMYGATGMIPSEVGQSLNERFGKEIKEIRDDVKVDTYNTGSYDELVDSPIMYCEPDTAVIQVANTEVLISSYSPNKLISAKEISESIREVLMAQRDFMGGVLPVHKYAFLFYFEDGPTMSTGALEHSYSSMYFLKEKPIEEMNQWLRDVAAHEFFHIITPLNIHSEEIHSFDFNTPKMSQHLWLYEGVTEYFAGNAQVKGHLISNDEYLSVIRQKLLNTTQYYKSDRPFTEFSKDVLNDQDEFGNVYQKGALIGMCLDIKLRVLSAGEYGMQNLVRDLAKKFGKQQPFKDDELFDHITEMTYSEIGAFLNTHVGKNEPLPFKEVFEYVGVDYFPEITKDVYTIGITNQSVGFDKETGKFFIKNEEALDAFGKKIGLVQEDRILELNGKKVPGPSEIIAFINEFRSEMVEGERFEIKVLRKVDDVEQEVDLATVIFKVPEKTYHVLKFVENPSEPQLKMRKAWLSENT